MINRKKKLIFAALLTVSSLYASTFFSGYAGGKLNYSGDPKSVTYSPELTLQAFFAGQFNFSQNTWAHMEFSVNTSNFLSNSFFSDTSITNTKNTTQYNALFQIDELSYIIRGNLSNSSNYFSGFMGTYDPIGSDIFLQRYFSIEPIASKLTESYMGLAGSILYPQFGFGIADVLRLHSYPMAFGSYVYFNQGDEYLVLNADLRYACVFRYFTCDFAAGIGVPLANQYKGEEVIVAVDTIYWHTGTTVLIGNNYTNSLFFQAGVYNVGFTAKQGTTIISPKDIYLLLEPRFVSKNFHLNFSLYSIPENTANKLLFVDDTLGADLNLYSTNIMIGPQTFTFGSHLSFSMHKTIFDFASPTEIFSSGYNINITPYVSLPFLSGELHAQGKVKIMEFANGNGANALSFDLGYRTRF